MNSKLNSLLLALALWLPAAAAMAEPVRMQRPNTLSFDGSWPKGISIGYQRQLLPQLSVGANAGFLGLVNLGLNGRWFFAETPGSWYVEALALAHLSTLPANQSANNDFRYSINALLGWEYRDQGGFTWHLAGGLGVTPNLFPGVVMGLINLDAGLGYSF